MQLHLYMRTGITAKSLRNDCTSIAGDTEPDEEALEARTAGAEQRDRTLARDRIAEASPQFIPIQRLVRLVF